MSIHHNAAGSPGANYPTVWYHGDATAAGAAADVAYELAIELGAAMRTHADAAWPAIGVAIAVALHKPLDAMSITGLMMQQGWSLPSQMAINLGYAAVCPLGAVLLLLGMTDPTGYWVAAALAVSAGVFVCIALSDLLPEMEFHSHDRGTLTAALMLGVGIAGLLAWLEPVHTH